MYIFLFFNFFLCAHILIAPLPGLAAATTMKKAPPPVAKKSESAIQKNKRLISKKEKSENLPATADQFSGALQWAHKKGIRGTDQTAIVLEKEDASSILSSKLQDHFLSSSDLKGSKYKTDHATTVIDAMHRSAPASKIVLLPSFFNLSNIGRDQPSVNEWVRSASVINYSQGHNEKSVSKKIMEQGEIYYRSMQVSQTREINLLKILMEYGEPKLLFLSAGNEKRSVSEPLSKTRLGDIYRTFNYIVSNPFLHNRVIIVGGLDQFFNDSISSNYPGWNKELQERFIFTLGSNIKLLADGQDQLKHGTSFATPIAAGCALLIKQRHRHFTPPDIQEVMLESASKNFFIEGKIRAGKQTGIFVYDPADGPPDLSNFKDSSQYEIRAEPFNPEVYGKGVLDLRAAFVYADLKVKNPSWDKISLRTEMKLILRQKDHQSATKIQAAFRGYKARKELKNIK